MNQTISQLQSIVPDLLSVMKNTDSSPDSLRRLILTLERIQRSYPERVFQAAYTIAAVRYNRWAEDMNRSRDIERFLREV